MRKSTYFDTRDREGWPDPGELRRYFIAARGREWFSTGGCDSAGLTGEGLFGTERLSINNGRIDVHLAMHGKPGLGVMLCYQKAGQGYDRIDCYSLDDASRLREQVENLEGYLHPVGLHVPFDRAFAALTEFIETEGELPKSIEWIAARDLPRDSFPV